MALVVGEVRPEPRRPHKLIAVCALVLCAAGIGPWVWDGHASAQLTIDQAAAVLNDCTASIDRRRAAAEILRRSARSAIDALQLHAADPSPMGEQVRVGLQKLSEAAHPN